MGVLAFIRKPIVKKVGQKLVQRWKDNRELDVPSPLRPGKPEDQQPSVLSLLLALIRRVFGGHR